MANNTEIQWTDATLNALIGCSKYSDGCRNCYAMNDVWRMAHNGKFGNGDLNPYAGLVEQNAKNGTLNWTGRFQFIPRRLRAVLKNKEHTKYFVNSLSDLFHDNVADEVIFAHLDLFRDAHWHQFQVLTKRSKRLLKMSPQLQWPTNVWMGVSVESPAQVNRIPDLGKSDAAIKFISFEPWISGDRPARALLPHLRRTLAEAGINWAIIGGESSKDKEIARFMDLDDVRYLADESREAGAKVFLKQLGTRWAIAYNTYGAKDSNGKRIKEVNAGGALEVWPEEFQEKSLREYPLVETSDSGLTIIRQ